MKTLHKIIALGLVTTIPLGLLADDRDYDHDEKGSKYMEMYMKKGVNYMFEGKLQAIPKTGLNGTWTISGKKIVVDDSTIIFQEDSNFEVGDELYVAAKRENGKIKAIEIEQD